MRIFPNYVDLCCLKFPTLLIASIIFALLVSVSDLNTLVKLAGVLSAGIQAYLLLNMFSEPCFQFWMLCFDNWILRR